MQTAQGHEVPRCFVGAIPGSILDTDTCTKAVGRWLEANARGSIGGQQ